MPRPFLRGVLFTLSFSVTCLAADAPKGKHSLSIQVVDAATQEPLSGATVTVRNVGKTPPVQMANAEGRVVVEIETPVNYVMVHCRAAGHVPTAVLWEDRYQPLELPASFTVPMAAGAKISGRVVDEAGKAVAGAEVEFDYYQDRPSERKVAVIQRVSDKVKTDGEGRWAWDGAPPDALDRIGFRVEHPDFVKAPANERPPAKALLDGTGVTKLDRGVDVSGRVVSATGKPVEGATVTTVQNVGVSNDYGLTVKTDSDGKFTLAHLPKGAAVVTVSAKGFAPEVERLEAKGDLPPLEVTLLEGKPLKGRVVDPAGKPIAKASLRIDNWRNVESLRWSGTTGVDGRFEMPDAPTDGVQFTISADGYRYKLRELLKASDEEVVVTMRPHPVAKGRVVDAATKKPLEKFRVVEGIALWEGRPPFFEFDQKREFTGGTYEWRLEPHDEVVASYVRVEADGYRPVVSPPIGRDATEPLVFDVELARAEPVTGTVLNPDGTPVSAGTKVLLAMPGEQVMLIDSQLSHADSASVTTDAKGNFKYDPQPSNLELVVVTDAGYAIVPVKKEQARADVKLSPWARLEGVYRPDAAGGAPPAGERDYLSINVQPVDDPRSPAANLIWQTSAKVGPDGTYAVERLPHYGGEVVSLMIGRLQIQGMDERRWVPLRLRPGETTRLDVGGKTSGQRAVVGKAVPFSSTDDIPDGQGWVLLTRAFDRPAGQWPTDLKEAAAMYEPVYRAHLGKDGSFVVPAVSPGKYEFSVTGYGTGAWARASGMVTVPEAGRGAVDAGEIRYRLHRVANVGEDAPADLGRTFDDKPLKLQDFRGKYVVLALWDSCSGRSDKHLPHLDALGAKFGGDGRVALLSVNMDPVSCGTVGLPKRPATLKHPAWVRGYISLSQDVLMGQIGGKQWPAIVIISPEGKLLARDLEGAGVEGKLAELLKR